MKFEKIIMRDDILVHCSTSDQLKNVLGYMSKKGVCVQGYSSRYYVENSDIMWDKYKENTCVSARYGLLSGRTIFCDTDIHIIPYDFVVKSKVTFL